MIKTVDHFFRKNYMEILLANERNLPNMSEGAKQLMITVQMDLLADLVEGYKSYYESLCEPS